MRALFMLCLLFIAGVASAILLDIVADDVISLPLLDSVEEGGVITIVAAMIVLNVSAVILGTLIRPGRPHRMGRRRPQRHST